MIGYAAHHITHSLAFSFRVGAKIVIEKVKEKMAVEFIAAGVRFPKPFSVSTFGPAWIENFPQLIPSLFLAVAFDAADIWIRPIDRPYRTGDKTRGWRRFATLRHFLQKAQRLERFSSAVFSLCRLGCGISETFACSIHSRPETVIITILRVGAGFIGRFAQRGFGDETKRSPFDVILNFLFVILSLFSERHGAAFDAANARRGCKPCFAGLVYGDLSYAIIRQPGWALSIMPLTRFKPNRAQPCSKPHLTIPACSNAGEIIPRQPIFAFIEFPSFRSSASHTRALSKPELTPGIQGNPEHIFRGPGAPVCVCYV